METKRKGYFVTDPRLAKVLYKYGLSCARIGVLIGADKNRTNKIMIGQYPISRYDLEVIERSAQEKNPKFTLDDFSFKEEGFVSEDGTKMLQCRRCTKWFRPDNARMRYCSDYCRDHKSHKTEKPYQEEETPEEQDTWKAESTYEEAKRRHINYGDVQKERILATEPTVMQRWEAYQRERQCKTSGAL